MGVQTIKVKHYGTIQMLGKMLASYGIGLHKGNVHLLLFQGLGYPKADPASADDKDLFRSHAPQVEQIFHCRHVLAPHNHVNTVFSLDEVTPSGNGGLSSPDNGNYYKIIESP